MIIECVNCTKKFTINSELIPYEGRTIQCGSCNHVWYFKKKKDDQVFKKSPNLISVKNEIKKKETLKKDINTKIKINNKLKRNHIQQKVKKGSEIIKYQTKSNFTFAKILSYTLVLVVSFTAFIIFLDTFKSPLYSYFPNLEFLLFNLYETIEDIKLFMSDLV